MVLNLIEFPKNLLNECERNNEPEEFVHVVGGESKGESGINIIADRDRILKRDYRMNVLLSSGTRKYK